MMEVRSRLRRAALPVTASVCTVALLLGCASTSANVGSASVAAADSPTVTPATGGGGVPVLPGFTEVADYPAFDLSAVGYEASEVFLSGTASWYEQAGPFGNDGKYSVTPAGTAEYMTRAVIARPSDPARFNGTVVVEWFNVTGGLDAGPDWMMAHNQLIREGFAWVGVSAQAVGVNALKSDEPVMGVTAGDPERYGDLSHPGDSFSYDIFSQAGQAIRDSADVFLDGLEPERLIGVGESQSATRMVTYVNAVHPTVEVYDGFLVHSRFGGGAALSQTPQPAVGIPSTAPIRDDLDVPVIVFQTEGDVSSAIGARQDDSDMVRYWEVAGSAHFDDYGLNLWVTDLADHQGAAKVLDSMLNPNNEAGTFTCSSPVNRGHAHFVLDAAFHQLNRWIAEGTPAPEAPRLEVVWSFPVIFATDEHGNALGGIRTPAVDVPVAKITGQAAGGDLFCFLFGSTEPFTQEKLDQLYPTHEEFVDAWIGATLSAYEAGFMTAQDAWEQFYAALTSDIGT